MVNVSLENKGCRGHYRHHWDLFTAKHPEAKRCLRQLEGRLRSATEHTQAGPYCYRYARYLYSPRECDYPRLKDSRLLAGTLRGRRTRADVPVPWRVRSGHNWLCGAFEREI